MANQPRNIGERPHAGQRNFTARDHKITTGWAWLARGVASACCGGTLSIGRYRIGVSCAMPWSWALPERLHDATVPAMYTAARFLQLIGLTIPLLAIVAQLNNRITQGQMLGFLAVAVGVFLIGHVLQRYSGGGQA
jgi:hypothetical protein